MPEVGPLDRYRNADDTIQAVLVAMAGLLAFAVSYQGGAALAGVPPDFAMLVPVVSGTFVALLALIDDTQ